MRLPMNEVGAGANGVLIVALIGNPHERPQPVVVLEEGGVGHFLLGTPGAEVAVDEGASVSQRLPVDAVAAVFECEAAPVDIRLQPALGDIVCHAENGGEEQKQDEGCGAVHLFECAGDDADFDGVDAAEEAGGAETEVVA